jgi:hypothetical protein
VKVWPIRWLFGVDPVPTFGRTKGRGPNIHRRKVGPGRKARHVVNPPGTKLRRFFAKHAA